MKLLTNRQQQIFNLIKNCVEETGYPPTRVEIASKLGFKSPNAAEDHLRALAKKGVIQMIPGASRGIRIVQQERGLPIVGRVAAGEPILSDQNISTINAHKNVLKTPNLLHLTQNYYQDSNSR